MKKFMALTLVVLGLTLTGCTKEVEENTDLTDLQATVTALQTQVTGLANELTASDSTIIGLETELESTQSYIEGLESDITTLEGSVTILELDLDTSIDEIDVLNAKLRNTFARDSWKTRKINYDEFYNEVPAEYCFGIFDEDWTTETPSDFTNNTGLIFVITIESISWGTEIKVTDSCGNYSEFLYEDSAYGLYSIPVGFFEVGKTYEVVLYKEVYFTLPQLGLLPVSDMEAYGAFPTDLSGIVSTEITE